MQFGRIELFTDVEEVTKENIADNIPNIITINIKYDIIPQTKKLRKVVHNLYEKLF